MTTKNLQCCFFQKNFTTILSLITGVGETHGDRGKLSKDVGEGNLGHSLMNN